MFNQLVFVNKHNLKRGVSKVKALGSGQGQHMNQLLRKYWRRSSVGIPTQTDNCLPSRAPT